MRCAAPVPLDRQTCKSRRALGAESHANHLRDRASRRDERDRTQKKRNEVEGLQPLVELLGAQELQWNTNNEQPEKPKGGEKTCTDESLTWCRDCKSKDFAAELRANEVRVVNRGSGDPPKEKEIRDREPGLRKPTWET